MNVVAMPSPRMLSVASEVLGPLTIPETRLVRFPDGLLGFPDTRDYVLVPAGGGGSYWLQSAEHPSLIFFLVDPFLHFDDYEVELAAPHVESLGARSHGDVAILAIVTLPPSEDTSATANLQGPLALNLSEGIGRQVILRDSAHGVRRPLSLLD